MLRIREYNKITGKKIDLKELEKFGFMKDEYGYFLKNEYDVVVLRVFIDTRKISNRGDKFGNMIFYDLIQAGYVEKVEEE